MSDHMIPTSREMEEWDVPEPPQCECRTGCGCMVKTHAGLGRESRCIAAAVRMVTVRGEEPPRPYENEPRTFEQHIPMCEPCATWHEKGGRNA